MSFSVPKRGRPVDEVWSHYEQGERDPEGHVNATCNYCHVKFSRGELTYIKGHLANHCKEAPAKVIRQYQTIFEEKQSKKKRKTMDKLH